eukprot:661392-Lingulodinium_polyedra.AAC.1
MTGIFLAQNEFKINHAKAAAALALAALRRAAPEDNNALNWVCTNASCVVPRRGGGAQHKFRNICPTT